MILGSVLRRAVTALVVAALFLLLSFVMNTSPVARSTNVLIPGLWSRDSTVSPSQSPIRVRWATTVGRSSIEAPFRLEYSLTPPCAFL